MMLNRLDIIGIHLYTYTKKFSLIFLSGRVPEKKSVRKIASPELSIWALS